MIAIKRGSCPPIDSFSTMNNALNRERFKNGPKIFVAFLALLVLVSGCTSIGPGTIPRDRFDYSTSMTESWKRQTLLNIVRLRYLDPPSFVDVGQIVAGYSLQTGIDASANFAKPEAGGSGGRIGGHAVYTDRPTITYTPLTGSRFIRGLMTPIPPESLFYTIQSGWPADAILEVGVTTINGLKNEEISIGGYRPPDPKFLRAAELMKKIQISGAVGMKIILEKNNSQTKVITFRPQGVPPEVQKDVDEFRQLLGLNPTANEFQLAFGATASNDQEIALQTRSLLHILSAMAVRVEVPPEHSRDGRAAPGVDITEASARKSMPRIRCTADKPKNAFAAVEYRDHWFWIDDCDLVSKRSFSYTMLLFTLADTGEKEALPTITIPAQ
jgi:hypothetical protein